MSLTSDFLKDHITFMKNQVIYISDQISPRDGKFELKKLSDHAATLESSAARKSIAAYLVRPVANNKNLEVLPSTPPTPYYMLTTLLDGCQFIAYGSNRWEIMVEHNNWKNATGEGDRARYVNQLTEISRLNPAYLFNLSPSDVDNIGERKYDRAHAAFIVGAFDQSDGWQFWVRFNAAGKTGEVYGPF